MITVPHASFFSSLQTLGAGAPPQRTNAERDPRDPRGSLSDEIIVGKHNKKEVGQCFQALRFHCATDISLAVAAKDQQCTAGCYQ